MTPRPTLILWREETPTGTVYHPGNGYAETLAKLMGKRVVKPHQLPLIEALGFRVAYANGQPIPHPGYLAYERQPADAKHVRDLV